jgi:hypothetical protein
LGIDNFVYLCIITHMNTYFCTFHPNGLFVTVTYCFNSKDLSSFKSLANKRKDKWRIVKADYLNEARNIALDSVK